MKTVLYAVVVTCFVLGGILDIKDGDTKSGVVAIGFGVLNGLIFLWR